MVKSVFAEGKGKVLQNAIYVGCCKKTLETTPCSVELTNDVNYLLIL